MKETIATLVYWNIFVLEFCTLYLLGESRNNTWKTQVQKANKKPKKQSKHKTLRRGRNFKLDKKNQKKTQEEKMINQVPTKPFKHENEN
jgi:hypothetical protein